MSGQLAAELERLYRDYYADRLDFGEYRRRRAMLLDSLLVNADDTATDQTQPRRTDTITQVERVPSADIAAPEKRRGFHWAAVLAACVVIVVGVVAVVLRQTESPPSPPMAAEDRAAAPAPTLDEIEQSLRDASLESELRVPEVGQALVEDFLARQDWRRMSLLEFQESWGRFPASDRIVAKGAVWFEPMAKMLEQRIDDAWAVAIDPGNDEQLDQLYEFSLHLGLVELVPPGWTPNPRNANRGAARATAQATRTSTPPPPPAAAAEKPAAPAAKAVETPAVVEDEKGVEEATATVPAAAQVDPQAANEKACSRSQLQTRRRNCVDVIAAGIEGPLMRVLPEGGFTMGSDDLADAQPARGERVPEPFAISVYEITTAEFKLFCEQTGTPCPPAPWPGDDMPVVGIDWHQAAAYCAWLSEKTGRTYRLPTEIEWEYAARAGTTTAYPYGDKLLPAQARYSSITAYDSPLPASDRTTQRNEFGLWHVVGNVREWVASDWNGAAGGANLKVVRGGSYASDENGLQSAARAAMAADAKDTRTGFRVVRGL